jgi:hypothetical protein
VNPSDNQSEAPDKRTRLTTERIQLIETFRTRTKRVNHLLENFDVHGVSTPREKAEFFEALATEGEELIGTFRKLVKQQGGSARARILRHLQARVGQVVEGATLATVAGISAWARRVRELDVEKGYNITTNETDNSLRPGQYRLESLTPDTQRAAWWRLKSRLRKDRKKLIADKLLALLVHKVGHVVTGEDFAYVANGKDWSSALRRLRSDGGWRISSKTNRKDLKKHEYALESTQPVPQHLRIESDVWSDVLKRDELTCRNCEWSAKDLLHRGVVHFDVLPRLSPSASTVGKSDQLETLCNNCFEERLTKLTAQTQK